MSACDNKLKSNLMEAMKLDNQILEAEMQTAEPHVFSDTHQKKMEKLLRTQKRKQKTRNAVRYVAAACVVLLFISSIFIISSEDLQASKLSVDIIEWLEDFFSTEKGTESRREENEVLFREEQIGYLPEGFEKIEEFSNIALAYYRYKNGSGETLRITIGRDKTLLQFDNIESTYEVSRNESGYEYTATYDEKAGSGTVIWQDANEIYYYISGEITYEELVKVMNSIAYQ